MPKTVTTSLTAIAICLNVFAAMPVSAQPAHGPTQQGETSQHYQRLYAIMKDMSEEMARMTEQMARGPLAPEQRADMAQKMDRMSAMMHRMSGLALAARPAMSDPESQKQMEEMRKQMDEMKRTPMMQPRGPDAQIDLAADKASPFIRSVDLDQSGSVRGRYNFSTRSSERRKRKRI